MPRVFVSRSLPGDALTRLAEQAEVDVWPDRMPPSPAELSRRVAEVDGLITMITERVDDDLLAVAPRLRVVANVAVGVDNLDLVALSRRGIAVGNTPGVLVDATADLTLALVLAVARRVVEADRAVRAGEWVTWDPQWLLGRQLAGATFGILGLGAIGTAVAHRAAAFGMRVVAWNRTPRQVDGVEMLEQEEVLRTADVLSLHCALTDDTRGLIDHRALALMKTDAILVNTARGPLVDEVALEQALHAGQLFGVGLDVAAVEPMRPDHPLLTLPRVTVLPHLGSATSVTRERMAAMAVDNVIAGLAGTPLPWPVRID